MKMPKTITSIIEFEVAKTKIENKGLTVKITSEKAMQKKVKKLIRLTSKYIIKLAKLHYDTAKVYFDNTEFVVSKYPLKNQEDKEQKDE